MYFLAAQNYTQYILVFRCCQTGYNYNYMSVKFNILVCSLRPINCVESTPALGLRQYQVAVAAGQVTGGRCIQLGG